MCSFVALFSVVFTFLFVMMSIVSSYPLNNGDSNIDSRYKREHSHGITGPVHTYVKTDKHANFKWGVRHHVGHHYAGRK